MNRMKNIYCQGTANRKLSCSLRLSGSIVRFDDESQGLSIILLNKFNKTPEGYLLFTLPWPEFEFK